MCSCQVKWSTERNVRSKQENTFGACGQEKAMLPVGSIGGERGLAHRWELRSVDPTSPAIRQLGDTLYNLRTRAGLTQQQLAALTGGRWSRSHIGRVENGDVTPSPDFVEAMDGLLDGGRALVRCLPVLLLETARQRSTRQWQRREPCAPAAGPNQQPQEPPRGLEHSSLNDLDDRPPRDPAPTATRPLAPSPRPSDTPASGSSPSGRGSSGSSPSGSGSSGPSPSGSGWSGPSAPDPGTFEFGRGDPASPPTGAGPAQPESRSTANRSQFLRMTLWTGLGAVLESLRLTLRVEGPAGGPVSHEQLELAVEQYAQAYWAAPASVLFGQVRQCRQLVEGMFDQRQPANRRRHLHLVAGWLSALLGNLSFHLGDYGSARMHLCTAWLPGSGVPRAWSSCTTTARRRRCGWPARGKRWPPTRWSGRSSRAGRRLGRWHAWGTGAVCWRRSPGAAGRSSPPRTIGRPAACSRSASASSSSTAAPP